MFARSEGSEPDETRTVSDYQSNQNRILRELTAALGETHHFAGIAMCVSKQTMRPLVRPRSLRCATDDLCPCLVTSMRGSVPCSFPL